jgi:hypothetical protein
MMVKMFNSDKHFGLINMRQRVLERNTAVGRKEEAAVPDISPVLVVVVVVVVVEVTAAVAVHICCMLFSGYFPGI